MTNIDYKIENLEKQIEDAKSLKIRQREIWECVKHLTQGELEILELLINERLHSDD